MNTMVYWEKYRDFYKHEEKPMSHEDEFLQGVLVLVLNTLKTERFFGFYDFATLKRGRFTHPPYQIKDGDEIVIYTISQDKKRKRILWSGIISLRAYRPLTKKIRKLYLYTTQKKSQS